MPPRPLAPKGSVPWYRPVRYGDLPGWERDDHLAAFQTFFKSCGRVIARSREGAAEADSKRPQVPPAALVAACTRATAQAAEITTKEAARAFFEENFTPNAVVKKGQASLLTGYYEPVLQGSRTADGPYQTPIYRRPPDLVNVVDDTRRGALKPSDLTHVRKTSTGTEPYFTRAEIEGGALKGKGLELLYFSDPVEVFFMQIQGSGRVRLTDGSTVRIHYDGKNGHPYSSIGRYLIEKAILAADRMSMAALAQWLRSDPERGRKVMWQNSSYVFFREIKDDVGSPLGAMRVPLTPERSLAIDPSYHALGTPIYLSVPAMKHVPKASPFHRLMVGQDVGSAIRGARARRHLFRLRRRGRQAGGQHQVSGPLLRAGAQQSAARHRRRSGTAEGAGMNHGSGGRPGKGGRQVTEDEADLWRQLTHSVDKVKAKPRVATHGLTADAFGGASGPAASPVEPGKRARQRPASRCCGSAGGAGCAGAAAPAARRFRPAHPAPGRRRQGYHRRRSRPARPASGRGPRPAAGFPGEFPGEGA